jgi:hypothetical protein
MSERLRQIYEAAIVPALALLPRPMTSQKALVMLLAIGLQESRFEHRAQLVAGRPDLKGPARGFWQFEQGTRSSRGGVWGVFLHDASRYWLNELCTARGVPFNPPAIWSAVENDDVLAAGAARLLLFTDVRPLPELDDEAGAWRLYAFSTWRPGRPHPETWPAFHKAAREFVMGLQHAVS